MRAGISGVANDLLQLRLHQSAGTIPLEYPVDEKFLARMDSELAGWSDPVKRLGDALKKNEFELYCQPIVALAGGEHHPMGEVLVRMREEERALLPPGEFLPAFEHYGMMPQLDRWVVFHAVQRLARGSRIARFCLNISGQTLQDAQFLPYVDAAAQKYDVAATSLVFEIDEADVLGRLEPAVRFANAAKALGCGVLIDGFGRRAVSFNPLKVLRVDFVKVDGAIVRKLLASDLARTKMNAILRVAEALGIGVIAENVEDDKTLAALKSLNVSHAQGFGLHVPQPIDTIAGAA
jgi:EAL domain-containing protein (putative c-di-GMP-specific phosphodiesterase class I)